MLLRHLRGQKLMDLRGETEDLLNRFSRVIQQREDLERAIAAAPDDANIAVIVNRLKTATHTLTLLNEQANQLDAAITAQRVKLEDCDGKLRQLWQGRMDKEFAHEDGWRMIQLAGRTRETMQLFLQRVTDTEVDRQYYQALQPSIARAYHLNYDDQNKRTVGEEGYFWKE